MVLWKPAPRADLTIQDSSEGVQFRVCQRRSRPEITWNFVLALFMAYFVTSIVSTQWSWQRISLVLLGGFGLGLWFSRERVVSTAFRRDGVAVRGWLGIGYPLPRWTRLHDISELLWQPEWHGGPESTDLPSGLYARRGLTLVCLVPFLDAEQAHRAMEAIEQRFSWVDREGNRQNSLLFADDFVRLGLDRDS